jgi:hypothetical protein
MTSHEQWRQAAPMHTTDSALRRAGGGLTECRRMGPAGVLARVAAGVTLVLLALFWRDPTWTDAIVGLLVFPHAVTALLALRARFAPRALRATGPLGHLANAAIFVPLFAHPATAGAAFLFYGGSMLIAAARRSAGCEVTAISNAVLDRRDEIGCLLFAPVDLAEARLRRSP